MVWSVDCSPSFDQIVADMERKGTELIFDAMDEGANRRFCDTLERRKYDVKAKVTTVVGLSESVGRDFNERCRNVMFIAGNTPAFSATQFPGVAEFRQAFSTFQPGVELHQWALEGWLIAKMFQDGMEQLGGDPTRVDLIDLFNARSEEQLIEGVLISGAFQPGNFEAERVRQCTVINRWLDDRGGWVVASDPFPLCYDDAIQFFTKVSERGD